MLSEEDVEFAKDHIRRFYDTDFFPKHFAIEALWHNWDDVKRLLIGRNVSDLPLTTPRVLPWPKPRGVYRVVHQLDPLSSVAYTAAAHSVARAIEASRAPVDQNIACSYRIAVAEGSFFASGSGYTAFRDTTDKYIGLIPFVLQTDITDFYNQIYVHRVRNAISTADPRLESKGIWIEQLLMLWNSRSSQGIPVGPAASIIMAEAVLTDVDRFISDRGFPHTRYVDDFRIFGDSETSLRRVLRDLTTYLYEVHRLNLSPDKTKLLTSEEFGKEILHSQYQLEKIDIFEHIAEVANPYSDEIEEISTERGHEEAVQKLTELLDRVLRFPHLDLGLARAIIRKAKGLHLPELVPILLNRIDRFLPVVNDVFLYLAEVIPAWIPRALLAPLEAAVQTESASEPAFQVWAEWLITSAPHYGRSRALRKFVERYGSFYARARLAVIDRNIAWVREHRLKYFELAHTDRLAVILASPILARDEREPFLRRIQQAASGATPLERWYAKTAIEGAVDHGFAIEEDDIPF